MEKVNSYKDYLINKALKNHARILLPETDDSRVQRASSQLIDLGFNVINNDSIKTKTDKYIDLISNKSFTTNWTNNMKKQYLENSLNIGLVALDNNDVDCVVAGATCPTSDLLRSAIRLIGVKNDTKWVSSIFFMISPDSKVGYTYADCGVIPEPNSEQLCHIAYESSNFHKLLSGDEPKVAFLSFSTKGSANHYRVKKVQEAKKIFSQKYPNIIHDGEVQFDAAIDADISKRKIGDSKLNGQANVFIFPDLDSANIAYKVTQHLASFQALGPLLQGLKKPIHDLSRGCTIDDIICISAIAAMQSSNA